MIAALTLSRASISALLALGFMTGAAGADEAFFSPSGALAPLTGAQVALTESANLLTK